MVAAVETEEEVDVVAVLFLLGNVDTLEDVLQLGGEELLLLLVL